MTLTDHLALFSTLDILAASGLILAWALVGWTIENPPKGRPTVTVLMADYRRQWMVQMVTRQPRIFDAAILSSLRQGTTFLTSGCMIAIGAVLALAGNPERLNTVADELTLGTQSVLLWQARLLLVALLLSHAFLKFIWANRLFGYCAVIMAATPNDPEDPKSTQLACQAAEINIRAAWNFNRGLRSIYFALATLAWLIGPVALIAATLACTATLAMREFGSNSRDIIMGKL